MSERHDKARDIRIKSADIAHKRSFTRDHPNNREEDEYQDKDGNRNFIANFTKGLPHHDKDNRDVGEVKNKEYRKLLSALKSGKQEDFNKISLGGKKKIDNPQSGLAFDLEGPDAQDLKMPEAPKIRSRQATGELAELYWMALCRDVQFLEYDIILLSLKQ